MTGAGRVLSSFVAVIYALILAPPTAPEPVVAELCASGVRVVSLNPLRGTLEDVFLKQVANASREPEARSKAS